MELSLAFVIGGFLGFAVGVALSIAIDRLVESYTPPRCSHNCNQGRDCTCAERE